MVLDQRKLALIAAFLQDSSVGCSVFYEDEGKDHVGRLYRRIVNDTTGKILHRVLVSRAFLAVHGDAEILPDTSGPAEFRPSRVSQRSREPPRDCKTSDGPYRPGRVIVAGQKCLLDI